MSEEKRFGLTPDKWVWMPHAAHFICGNDCRFHLATYVGNFIVSTVGEYVPDEGVREIHAQCRGVVLRGRGDERLADFLKKIGYVEIGHGRTYETMVFRAMPSQELGCCPYQMSGADELDFRGYTDAAEAYAGHMELCEQWSRTDPAAIAEGS